MMKRFLIDLREPMCYKMRQTAVMTSKTVKYTLLGLGLLAGIFLLLISPPDGLSTEGARCLGVAVICSLV